MKNTPSLAVEHWTGEINAILSSVATAFSGWLAPIPEAAMTAQAIIKIFELPPLMAVLAAASIELTGISVNAHFLEVVAYNENEELLKQQRNRNTHVHGLLPEQGARRNVVVFYVVTGLIVACTAIYEVIAEVAAPIKLLAVLFPVASAIGTLTMNRRAEFHRRMQRINSEGAVKVQRAPTAPSEPAPAGTAPSVEPTEHNTAPSEPPTASIEDWRSIYSELNGARATLTVEQLQALVTSAGLSLPSERTQYKWLQEARESGGGPGA